MAFIPEIIPEIPEIVEASEGAYGAAREAIAIWRSGARVRAARRALDAARKAGVGIGAAERAYRLAQRNHEKAKKAREERIKRRKPKSRIKRIAIGGHKTPSPLPSPVGRPISPPKERGRRVRFRDIPKVAVDKSFSIKKRSTRMRSRSRSRRGKSRSRGYSKKRRPLQKYGRSKKRAYYRGKKNLIGPTRVAPRFTLTSHNWPYGSKAISPTAEYYDLLISQSEPSSDYTPNYVYTQTNFSWEQCGAVMPGTSETKAYLLKGVKFIFPYTRPQGIQSWNLEIFLFLRPNSDPGGAPSTFLGETPGVKGVPFRVRPKQNEAKILMYRKYKINDGNALAFQSSESNAVYGMYHRKTGTLCPSLTFKDPITLRFVRLGSEGPVLCLGNNFAKKYAHTPVLCFRALPSHFTAASGSYNFHFQMAHFSYMIEEIPVNYS